MRLPKAYCIRLETRSRPPRARNMASDRAVSSASRLSAFRGRRFVPEEGQGGERDGQQKPPSAFGKSLAPRAPQEKDGRRQQAGPKRKVHSPGKTSQKRVAQNSQGERGCQDRYFQFRCGIHGWNSFSQTTAGKRPKRRWRVPNSCMAASSSAGPKSGHKQGVKYNSA